MAIEDLGLSADADTSSYASIFRISENTSITNVYVVFSTQLGAQYQETIDVAVSYRVIKRPGDIGSDDGWSDWSEWYWSRIPSAECRPHQIQWDSRWHWAVELSQVGEYSDQTGMDPSPYGTIKQQLFPNGYSLEQRKYDCIEMQIKVKTGYYEQYWESQGGQFSDVARNNSVVFSYVPNYYLNAIDHYDDFAIQVAYEAPAWQRNDDRYHLEEVYVVDTDENLLRPGNFYGTILGYNGGRGYIRIASDQLYRMPDGTENVHVKIRMNAGFNAIDQWFAYLEGERDIQDSTKCSTPLLELMKADQDSVQVRLHDQRDADVLYQNALCGMSLDNTSTDMATVENGGLYTIYSPPLGVEFEVYATGVATVDTQTVYSDSVRITVPPIEGESKMVITPVYGNVAPVEVRYNVSEDWTFEPEQENVKFATRGYDSVAFGYGGSSTGNVSCVVMCDPSCRDGMYQDPKAFEDLLFAGLCILRGPDGERRRVAVESVKVERTRSERFCIVKISMREVQ